MDLFSLHFMYSGFRGIFGCLTILAWVAVLLYSRDYMKEDRKKTRFYMFVIVTMFATLGVFFAADLYTIFVCFEVMSLTSFVWVAHRQTKQALYAAGTYLGIAIAGGLAILMGIFILYHELGTLALSEIMEAAAGKENKTPLYIAAVCLFTGFGAKAGAFPLHVWLPDSYTEAPAPATALLSAILSKTGIFGVLLVSTQLLYQDAYWGIFILAIGVVTMVYGGLRGVLSINLKTTIAYSSMSQIGFILVGIGMYGLLGELGNQEALSITAGGTLLHMVNHTLVKLVLFLVAGIVFMNVGSYDLNEVRGFGHGKYFLHICFLLAAAGVGGIPLLNGYISKTLLHESIVEYRHLMSEGLVSISMISPQLMELVEVLFLLSGGLTLAYMAKLYIVLFIQKNENSVLQQEYEQKKDYMTIAQKLAIGICVVPIPFLGLMLFRVADKLMEYGMEIMHADGFEHKIAYFSLTNLSGALISIVAAVVIYLVFVRLLMVKKNQYRSIWPDWLSMEKYVYRAILYKAIPFVICVLSRILDSVTDWFVVLLRKTVYCDRRLPHELTEGNIVTHDAGIMMEAFHKVYCQITHKKYERGSYEHKAALKSEDIVENFRIIERSLSFGLFMFCMGLGLTLIYLLIVNQ